MSRPSAAALLCLLLASTGLAVAGGGWGLNLYGLSYHWERDVARANGWDNEFNPGLGLRYQGDAWGPGEWFLDAGAYRDSGRDTALYAGAGWQAALDDARRWWLGGALVAFSSDTYNRGEAFIAPVPLLSWRLPRVTLNLTHFPKFDDFNEVNTTALFVTLPLR